MSIIEKAASRIDRQRSTAGAVPVTPAPREPVVAPEAVPVLETPVAPTMVSPPEPATVLMSDVPPATPSAAPPVRPRTRQVDLDLAKMRDMGLVTAAGGRTALLEEFRIIKRPLLNRAFGERDPGGQPPNLIIDRKSVV